MITIICMFQNKTILKRRKIEKYKTYIDSYNTFSYKYFIIQPDVQKHMHNL